MFVFVENHFYFWSSSSSGKFIRFFFLDYGKDNHSIFAFQNMCLMIFLGVLGGRMLGLDLMISYLGLVIQVIGIGCYVGLVLLISSFS